MKRVVITGLGVVAPGGGSVGAFEDALRNGRSGIKHIPRLQELNFSCQVAGVVHGLEDKAERYFSEAERKGLNESMMFAAIAAAECWRDAGFDLPGNNSEVDWDTGAIVGTAQGGIDTIGSVVVPRVDAGQVRRLGSIAVEQSMNSAASAFLGGFLGLGGQVSTNGSACATGSEAVANAYRAIKTGRVKRMIAGGTEGASPYLWGGFDSMRILAKGFNDRPHEASRPMSASSSGFVPAAGAGMLLLEELESAMERGAGIYAEIVGAEVNCGGQRNGGSMTAANPEGVRRCIEAAIRQSRLLPTDIDVINGHLSSTRADPMEIKNWHAVLGTSAERFPIINATKSLFGHALGAAGAIECVASALQLSKGFVHGNLNCEDLHPELLPFRASIPARTFEYEFNVLAKCSLGFGDVNTCLVMRRYEG